MYSIHDLNKNSKALLKLIQQNGPIAKNDLLLIANMTLSTLQRSIKPLLDKKLVIESAIGESTGGRRPALYDINPNVPYLIGIDISRSYTRFVITNLNLSTVFAEKALPISSPQQTIKSICDAITKTLNELSISKSNILGIGVGTVGPLDRENGIVLNPTNFSSKDWINIPIKDIIERIMDIPTFVDNGANSAVLGEHIFGIGKKFSNMAYFNCGMGIRTGVVSSNKLIRTSSDSEDSFGHMVIDMDGERCTCSNYGCVECYCSTLKITKKFKTKAKAGRSYLSSKPPDEIDYIDICNMAEQGDALAKEIMTDSAVIFGLALNNYVNILKPELVILSGPLFRYSKLYYNVATSAAYKKFHLKDKTNITFKREGKFAKNSISLGAAAMVVEELLNQE